MTLSDLFYRLDWTTVRANPDLWYKLYTTIDGESLVDEEYFRRFWCNIIYTVFYGEDQKLKEIAAQLLFRADMLQKVFDELKKEGMLYGGQNSNAAVFEG